jgi:uncharacterized protein
MPSAKIRFYAELNFFLPRSRRGIEFEAAFEDRQSIKDLIESLGVPHTEVDLILVNGSSVDFGYLVQDGDTVSVYPVFETLDISAVLKVRPEPLRVTRFVADVHLGRLAAHLRMLGFDTAFPEDYRDEELARISRDEHRIMLTRDRGLLKRSMVTHGYYVRSTNPRQQLSEVIKHFDLYRQINPFQRCIKCNGLLSAVSKDQVADRLPDDTRQFYDDFRQCGDCGQVYWKGPHYARMQQIITAVRAECG